MNGGWSSSKKRPGLDSGHWLASANQPRARATRQKSLPRKKRCLSREDQGSIATSLFYLEYRSNKHLHLPVYYYFISL